MMIALAVLLLAAAVLLAVAAVLGSEAVVVEVLNFDLNTSILAVFVVGLVTGLMALVGIAALGAGMRQTRARRREMRYLRQKVAEQDTASGPPVHDESAAKQPPDEPERAEESGRRAARAANRR